MGIKLEDRSCEFGPCAGGVFGFGDQQGQAGQNDNGPNFPYLPPWLAQTATNRAVLRGARPRETFLRKIREESLNLDRSVFCVWPSELIMNAKRVSLGFDLRVKPDLQGEIPSQNNQHLTSGLQSPLSADSSVWLQPREIESLWAGGLPNFSNPLNLATSLDLLVAATRRQGISISNLWSVCVTADQTDTIALVERY